LLAEVYIELIGGRQAALILGEEPAAPTLAAISNFVPVAARPEPRLFNVEAADLEAHRALIGRIGEKAIWNGYFAEEGVTELAG
jgi:DNA polymerase-3 subunit epsilon